MKREKGESDYTGKEKDKDDQFFIWSIIVSTSIKESTVSSVSNNFPFRDSLKDFLYFFLELQVSHSKS